MPRRVTSPAAASSSAENFSRALRASVAPAWRQAEPELAAHLFAEPTRLEVLPRRRAVLGIPERPLVEHRRLLEQRAHPVALLPLLVGMRRCVLVLDLHVEAVGEPLDRTHEVEPFRLSHERDRVAADAAAEAVVRPAVGRHGERRRSLLVERAQPGVAPADLAQARPRLDEVDDVRGRLDRLDRLVLQPRHVRPARRSRVRSGRSSPRDSRRRLRARRREPTRCSKILRMTSRARSCSPRVFGPR